MSMFKRFEEIFLKVNVLKNGIFKKGTFKTEIVRGIARDIAEYHGLF